MTTPFGFASTAADVLDGIDLRGQRVLITGGASGLGFETARALAQAGAEVSIAVRRRETGLEAVARLTALVPGAPISVLDLDLSDPSAIRACASTWRGPLHVLINNAGIMAPPVQRLRNGWDAQFAVNHLGHFVLARALHPALAATAHARVVVLSSSSHQIGPIDFDDLHFDRRPYEAVRAYGQSKTANALFAVEAARLWASDGISVNALMPGAVPTPLQRHVGGMKTPMDQRKTVEQGAATIVLLAASPVVSGVSGRYFADCQIARVLAPGEKDIAGVARHAIDTDIARRLWETSEAMTRQWS